MNLIFNPDEYPAQTRRGGLPYTKPVQIHILKYLYDPASRSTEQPFRIVILKDLGLTSHSRASIQSLIARDWIIESTKAFPETRHQITSRGIKALKTLMQSGKKYHAGELCSRCHQKPRHQYPSRLHTYCIDCIRQTQRKRRQFKGYGDDPLRVCSRCHKGKRRISSGGRVYAYCTNCLRIRGRERGKRNSTQ
jgi:hypothetical protein